MRQKREKTKLDERRQGEKNEPRRHEKEQMTSHSNNKMAALNSLKGFTVFLKHSRGNQLFTVIRHALRTIIIASRNK